MEQLSRERFSRQGRHYRPDGKGHLESGLMGCF